jgi:hypothetical protein
MTAQTQTGVVQETAILLSGMLQVALIPPMDGVVVQVEKLYDHSAALPIAEQQDRVCLTRNAVVFALTMLASRNLGAVC